MGEQEQEEHGSWESSLPWIRKGDDKHQWMGTEQGKGVMETRRNNFQREAGSVECKREFEKPKVKGQARTRGARRERRMESCVEGIREEKEEEILKVEGEGSSRSSSSSSYGLRRFSS